jgi:predicted ATP-grasp superfamily ATP-dependent carboligase
MLSGWAAVTALLEWLAEPPTLRRPVLLVALEGFVDAGAAAATAAMFLGHRWRSEPVARYDRERLIDYRARRPTVVIDEGLLRRIDWPDIELYTATVDGPRDAVLLLGPEPDACWTTFADATVDACHRLGVQTVLGLGAYPAAAPHTRPIRVVRAATAGAEGLATDTIPVAGYTGPVNAGTALQATVAEQGIPAVGLWAEVPHYIAASPNPAAALALVRLVSTALETQVDTTELEAAATHHREQVDAAVAEHAEAVEMVRVLEGLYDQGRADEDLPSGEDLAAEIERFLRNAPPGGTGPAGAGPA